MICHIIGILMYTGEASAQNVWVKEHEPARLPVTEEKLEREVGKGYGNRRRLGRSILGAQAV